MPGGSRTKEGRPALRLIFTNRELVRALGLPAGRQGDRSSLTFADDKRDRTPRCPHHIHHER
jgi:hypothetical protein